MQKGDKITARLGNRKQSGKILNTNTDSLAREEVTLKFWLRKMEVWKNSGPLREGGRSQGDEGAHSLSTTQDPPPTTQPGPLKCSAPYQGSDSCETCQALIRLQCCTPLAYLVLCGEPNKGKGKVSMYGWLVGFLCCGTSQSLDGYTSIHLQSVVAWLFRILRYTGTSYASK